MSLEIVHNAVWVQLIPLIIVLPLVVFWGWMLNDLVKNDDVPSIFRPYWVLAFILLNIPAAVFYYYTVYRNR